MKKLVKLTRRAFVGGFSALLAAPAAAMSPAIKRAVLLGASDAPSAPSGYAFLTDASGAYLVDASGNYLIGAV